VLLAALSGAAAVAIAAALRPSAAAGADDGAAHDASAGQIGVGADPDDDQDHVCHAGHRSAIGWRGLDPQPTGLACRAADLPDGAAGQDLHVAAAELIAH